MAKSDPVDRHLLERNQIAQSVLITIVAIVRIGSGFYYGRRFVLEDAGLAACWAFALTANIMYIYVLRAFFRTSDTAMGRTPMYAEIADDGVFIMKAMFAITTCYWSCLWAAKLALLFLTKKIMTQLPQYLRMWWGVFGLCILTWIGCMITLLLSCSSMEAWFTAGQCQTPRDVAAANISRYFSFATDVATNVLTMALPFRLIVRLQMPRSRKIGLIILFTLALVCIIAAAIRCTQIGEANGTPSFPWLALWGTTETTSSPAVLVCAGPGLYRAGNMTKKSLHGYYENGKSKTEEGLVDPSNAAGIEMTNGPQQSKN